MRALIGLTYTGGLESKMALMGLTALFGIEGLRPYDLMLVVCIEVATLVVNKGKGDGLQHSS